MVKPVVKKVMMGVPAVALSAALACTMAGCGGTEGGQGGSGDGTAATQAAYQSQSIDVEGFTVESLADGTYYRGDVYKADGFWLRVKITNNNDKAMKRFSFITTGAPGGYEAGDPVFDSHDTLSYDIKNPPAELCEGAETDGDPVIEPGESIEWVYFWTTKDNYYGPITVQFDKNATGGTDPRTMRFDTTGKETDGLQGRGRGCRGHQGPGRCRLRCIQREGCRRLGARRDQGEEQRRHVQPRGLHEALQHQHVLARPAEGSRGAAGQLRRQG